MDMSLYVDMEKDFGEFRLSMCFEAGDEVMGILGASGCGKSMTLRCIAGIVTPDRGRIVLNGRTLFDSEKKINLKPQERHVGLLFQNYALFPNMTVEQNLRTGLMAARRSSRKRGYDSAGGNRPAAANSNAAEALSRAEEDAAIAAIIERFYLTGLEKHRPAQLSGGQQQRAALARILLTKPEILMLDEPFSALDGYLRWNLELELTDLLREFGGTTLFVSHSRDEVYRVCDRICVMDRGHSTPVVPVKTMFERPETLAACMLSGCKNYSEAERCDAPECLGRTDGKCPEPASGRTESSHWVYAKDWGQAFDCGRPVPDGISNIGVRSHFIHILRPEEAAGKTNVVPCRILRIVEDVFSQVVLVKPEAVWAQEGKRMAEQNASQLRLEMTKEEWRAYATSVPAAVGDPILVYMEGKDILLLRSHETGCL